MSSTGEELADFTSFGGGSGGSTSELLDPHLPSLSKFWLAALKDKAFLFLPLELRDQLPSNKGGMFFSMDVMDDVKQYYEANWSSLLLAAAIWLQERGFHKKDEDTSTVKDSTSVNLPVPLLPDSTVSAAAVPPKPAPSPSDSRLDRFHLLLGLAVQTLCVPATLDQPHVLSNCLRTLRKLLCADVARRVISSDCRVGMELLGVMHRLLLTSTSLSIHVTAIQVTGIIGKILLHAISMQKSPADTSSSESKESTSGSGEGHSRVAELEVSLDPGKSCVYAILQVVACVQLRLVPNLRQFTDSSGSRLASPTSQPPKREELLVILHSIKVLGSLLGICAPEGSLSALPPVFHMLLSTQAYVCALAQSSALQDLVSAISSAGMQSLGQICSSLPLADSKFGEKITAIVQSALVSVLGRHAATMSGAKEEAELSEMDDGTRLVIVAVLLLRTCQDVCPAPSNLFDGCLSLFKDCLHSSDSKVGFKETAHGMVEDIACLHVCPNGHLVF